MAKRKKASKVQKRAKLRSSAKRGKAHKAAKAAKRQSEPFQGQAQITPVKKAARKVKPACHSGSGNRRCRGGRATRSGRDNCHGSRGDTPHKADLVQLRLPFG